MVNQINDIEIFNNFFTKYGKNGDFQLTTSNDSMFHTLFYIQGKYLEEGININIFLIRKNRIKTGLGQKIEGIISKENIICIDNIIGNLDNIYYIQKTLEVLGKIVFNIYVPILDIGNNIKKNIIFNNLDIKKLSREKTLGNQSDIKFIGNYGTSNNFDGSQKLSPQINNDYIIIVTDFGNISVLNKNTYSEIWSVNYKNKFFLGDFLVINGCIIIGTNSGELLKIDLKNGSQLDMIFIGDTINTGLSYINKNETIIAPVQYGSSKNNSSILLIDFKTFTINGELSFDNYISTKVLVIEEKDLIVVSENSGSIFVINYNNKRNIYSFVINGIVRGGLSFYGDYIVFGTTTGIVYKCDIKIGKIIFEKQLNNLWIYSKPLIIRNYIFIASVDKNMYILNENGDINNYIKTNGRIFSNPQLFNNKYIVYGSNDSKIYLYNIENSNLFSYQLSERIVNSIIFDKKNLIIQDFMNNLYSIKII